MSEAGKLKEVFDIAHYTAKRWNHEFVRTEHLLMAFCEYSDPWIDNFFKEINLDKDELNTFISKKLKPGPVMVTVETLPMTPRLLKAFDFITNVTKARGATFVGVEDIIHGLLLVEEGVALMVFQEFLAAKDSNLSIEAIIVMLRTVR